MRDSKVNPTETVALEGRKEEFFETFFRKGAEFANELLTELETLRFNAKQLSEENISLKHQLASDDAIRDLLAKIENLEEEKQKLRSHIQNVSQKTNDYAGRYQEVEKELDSMANLYVALYQLHATLSPQEVLGVIEQLLAQFVGAGSFVIYLRREGEEGPYLEPVHAYHCHEAAGTNIKWGEGPIGETAETQVQWVADLMRLEPNMPLACIPLVLGEEAIGVIVILAFFEQKDTFVDIDFEFFKLLAIHSASAIVGSGLMAQVDQVGTSLKSYTRL